ncbi:hypothetical protein F5X68DRAFT_257230 [Plectosphaerella plurivora]|uniref:Uncharacterized protein n=1 Tax=Plectosphaerella plurivora TaxID=936078 RepID=A0A9P8VNP0_9PEZI|nr:hypothetical protein F5X68DRAFT_257230 [Plectosphaerella plurivora]
MANIEANRVGLILSAAETTLDLGRGPIISAIRIATAADGVVGISFGLAGESERFLSAGIIENLPVGACKIVAAGLLEDQGSEPADMGKSVPGHTPLLVPPLWHPAEPSTKDKKRILPHSPNLNHLRPLLHVDMDFGGDDGNDLANLTRITAYHGECLRGFAFFYADGKSRFFDPLNVKIASVQYCTWMEQSFAIDGPGGERIIDAKLLPTMDEFKRMRPNIKMITNRERVLLFGPMPPTATAESFTSMEVTASEVITGIITGVQMSTGCGPGKIRGSDHITGLCFDFYDSPTPLYTGPHFNKVAAVEFERGDRLVGLTFLQTERLVPTKKDHLGALAGVSIDWAGSTLKHWELFLQNKEALHSYSYFENAYESLGSVPVAPIRTQTFTLPNGAVTVIQYLDVAGRGKATSTAMSIKSTHSSPTVTADNAGETSQVPPSSSPDPEPEQSSKAWIAGAVIGPLVLLGLVAILVWWLRRRRLKQSALPPTDAVPPSPTMDKAQLHSDSISPYKYAVEVDSGQVHELDASIRPAEFPANETPAHELPEKAHKREG